MNAFFQQVFALLTSETGSLAYHLVLVFSIVAALPAALGYGQSPAAQTARRMVLGLGLLLLLRIALFASTGLIWQGLLSSVSLLPLMERAITLLSLVVLIWMWAFPDPSKPADAGALLLGLLTLTAMILGLIWWQSQTTISTYNGSFLDTVGEIYTLILLGVGSLLLLIRRPHLWEIGLGMLVVMSLGHLFNLILPPGAENYSGVVRLAQMSAYPLLLALPQRLPLSLSRPLFSPSAPSRETAESRAATSLDPGLLQALLALSSEPDMQVAGPLVARTFAHVSMADCCFIVYPPDSAGQMPVIAGYDLIREQSMQGFLLSGKEAPNLAAAIRQGKALRISAGEGAPDLRPIARGLGLERTGNLLFLPVALAEAESLMGILLITPYTARAWSDQDQSLLAGLTRPLAQVLQRNQVLARMNAQMAELHHQSEDLKTERDKLLNQIKALRRSTTAERSQLESLAAMVATVESDQSTISSLMNENERLQGEIRKLQKVSPAEVERLEEELRLALQEIALLNSGLSAPLSPAHEPETGLFEPHPSIKEKSTSVDAASWQQIKEIVSLAQELRQPMSSMVGYTDVLLAESQGILGSKQRKFVEKIRVAIQRMSRLVDELIQHAALESFHAQKQIVQEIDLSLAIDEAVAQTSLQLREKSIALRVEMPEALPHLYADPETLRKIFVSLLQNAGNVTPDQGDIYLKARLESGDGRLDYVLVQVSDSGGGIPIDELPHLFSHVYQPPTADSDSGQAAAYFGHNGSSLANVKKLVESVGGRILVDSQPGQGATFSVLLPVSSTAGVSNS
jgi:nitrogen-specific signal transduction histidine kinase